MPHIIKFDSKEYEAAFLFKHFVNSCRELEEQMSSPDESCRSLDKGFKENYLRNENFYTFRSENKEEMERTHQCTNCSKKRVKVDRSDEHINSSYVEGEYDSRSNVTIDLNDENCKSDYINDLSDCMNDLNDQRCKLNSLSHNNILHNNRGSDNSHVNTDRSLKEIELFRLLSEAQEKNQSDEKLLETMRDLQLLILNRIGGEKKEDYKNKYESESIKVNKKSDSDIALKESKPPYITNSLNSQIQTPPYDQSTLFIKEPETILTNPKTLELNFLNKIKRREEGRTRIKEQRRRERRLNATGDPLMDSKSWKPFSETKRKYLSTNDQISLLKQGLDGLIFNVNEIEYESEDLFPPSKDDFKANINVNRTNNAIKTLNLASKNTNSIIDTNVNALVNNFSSISDPKKFSHPNFLTENFKPKMSFGRDLSDEFSLETIDFDKEETPKQEKFKGYICAYCDDRFSARVDIAEHLLHTHSTHQS